MPASRTAQYVALYRALESAAPAPHFQDPFARAFLSPSLALAVQASRIRPLRELFLRYADWRAPGARTSAIGRTCFIDDVVRDATREGARQVVLLGAGFDCRAHRMIELRDSIVFEVDREETQREKRAHIAGAGRARDDVRYVAVDFGRDDIAARLAAAGWDAALRTVFVWEGVTNYLTEPAVAGVLSWMSRAAPGSRLVFTYIHGGLLDGTVLFDGGERMLRAVRALGEPWTFGIHPGEVGEYLARFGLVLRDNFGADEYRRRYLGDAAGAASGYAFYRIAVADIAGEPQHAHLEKERGTPA